MVVGNPYQPGRGVPPPVLAGRKALLEAAAERLGVLAAGRMPSRDLLFYGPRGNGKTTLLIEIERRARKRGLRAEALPVDALTAEEKLVSHLQERAGFLRDHTDGATAAPSGDITRLFAAWIRADDPPLVILMDEVHALAPDAARPFFDAVQSAKREQQPFLVVAAGTPDAPRRVREAATYNERGFRQLRVGRLARQETVAALAEPAQESGRPLSGEAAALLAEESQDYPYFIQLLGRAAWKAAAENGDGGIGLDAAGRGVAASRPEIEEFYEDRYEEAADRGLAGALEPVAAAFREREGRIASAVLEARLREIAARDSVPLDAASLRNTLRNLGIAWRVSPGVWELGIPSFADFVLRRAHAPE